MAQSWGPDRPSGKEIRCIISKSQFKRYETEIDVKRILAKIKKEGIRRTLTQRLIRRYCKIRVFFFKNLFSENTPYLNGARVVQATQFVGEGRITINGARLGFFPSPGLINGCGYIEARNAEASIEIAENSVINNGFVIIADKSTIQIGRRCLIGPDFFVADSDFHGLNIDDRVNGNYDCKPVIIDDDVFIGHGVKVMKGVHIGRGAVIGSGSIVISDVEAFSVNAGVPAKKLRNLEQTEKTDVAPAITVREN